MWPVYDSRRALTNVVVQPEIRARFLRIEPGPAGLPHSHDLGGEAFLVLEGHAVFIIEGERVMVGPGQFLYVPPGVRHTVEAAGSEPCLLYLSVTPHVEPTHTFYGAEGQPLPPRYGVWRQAGQAVDGPSPSTEEALVTYQQAVHRLVTLTLAYAAALEEQGEALQRTATADTAALKGLLDALWPELRALLQAVRAVEAAWNALALVAAAGPSSSG